MSNVSSHRVRFVRVRPIEYRVPHDERRVLSCFNVSLDKATHLDTPRIILTIASLVQGFWQPDHRIRPQLLVLVCLNMKKTREK